MNKIFTVVLLSSLLLSIGCNEELPPASVKTQEPYSFKITDGRIAEIQVLKNIQQLNEGQAKEVLTRSFITEFRKIGLTPDEVDPSLKFWWTKDGTPSVEEFYIQDFLGQVTNFNQGKIQWAIARVDGEIAGWATFEPEANDKLYMDLLAVDPKYRGKGIGKQLVLSMINLGIFPKTQSISLLLRKKNSGGRRFYQKLGFKYDPDYHRSENHVKLDLLEGWTLHLDSR